MAVTACQLSEEDLWDGIDRNTPEIREHLKTCHACRTRAAEFQSSIAALRAAATPESPPLPEHVGPYTIRRRLGEGGMGIVYEGEQHNPTRLVAVKVVRGGHHVDEYRLKLFQREVQTLARLKHPAIASIYEAGRDDSGQHYFTMELVRGQRLNEYVREQAVPRQARLNLFCKICDAINYAHQRGVIHRDLKPSNIIIDDRGNPKILDFGLARITDTGDGPTISGTEIGLLRGTLPYMSPEEAGGDSIESDVRSDVYSLGVVLFELLTDQLPYTAKRAALHEAVRTICEEPPTRPSNLDRTLRGDLETITLKALEKERGRRYQSAAALAEDVQRYLTDQPILARRASILYRTKKLIVRHRVVFTVLIAMSLVMSGSALWIDLMGREIEKRTVGDAELQDLRLAFTEFKLATSLYEQGKLREAEPIFVSAKLTFERLGRVGPRRLGETLLGLGRVMIEREIEEGEDRPDDLLVDAAEYLEEALVIFRDGGSDWVAQETETLKALELLYSELWDDPEGLAEIRQELKRVGAGAVQQEPPSGPKSP